MKVQAILGFMTNLKMKSVLGALQPILILDVSLAYFPLAPFPARFSLKKVK
jgi:hypothetical protein